MAKKRYTPEIIIRKLCEAEVLQGKGQTVAQVVKQLDQLMQAGHTHAVSPWHVPEQSFFYCLCIPDHGRHD